MSTSSPISFYTEGVTQAWLEEARQSLRNPLRSWVDRWELIHRGICLRRQWDRQNPDAPERQDLLCTLARLQTQTQDCWEREKPDSSCFSQFGEMLQRHLADDERYLAELLYDEAADVVCRAVAWESFRDDLHWRETQTLWLEGAHGVDFLGRLLLLQEALVAQVEAVQEAGNTTSAPALWEASENLRGEVLTRRIEALLKVPPAASTEQCRAAWRVASVLLMQLGPTPTQQKSGGNGADRESPPASPSKTCVRPARLSAELWDRLQRYRREAASGWAKSLVGSEGQEALARTGEELCAAADEVVTFLEEVSLERGIWNLQIHGEDLRWWCEAVRNHVPRPEKSILRSVRRSQRRLQAELQERTLSHRMESLFGHRAVLWWERWLLIVLVLFLALLGVEMGLGEHRLFVEGRPQPVFIVLAWIDLAICSVFLLDFGVRMVLTPWRWLYLRRNWLTGLLPAIPFGFLFYLLHDVGAFEPSDTLTEVGEGVVLLRVLRYLRLPRMVRWLRIARPIMRLVRVMALLLRAMDRLVRSLTPLLNRNIVLFEQAAVGMKPPPERRLLSSLHACFTHRGGEILNLLGPEQKQQFLLRRIEDLRILLSSAEGGFVLAGKTTPRQTDREIPLDTAIQQLLTLSSAEVSYRVRRSLVRSIVQWSRALDVWGLRRLPWIREMVAAGRLADPYEVCTRLAHQAGLFLKHLLDRFHWVADFYGIVTAPQLLDTLGDYLVRATLWPARRLIVAGAGFLAISYLADLTHVPFLEILAWKFRQVIATPLIVLGLLCLIPMLIGFWLRRIAGEATDFYTHVLEAHFQAATQQEKARFAPQLRNLLWDRVLTPEKAMESAPCVADGNSVPAPEAVESSLKEPTPADSEEWTHLRSLVERLWEDYLRSPPYHPSDTLTPTQLQGNLALVSIVNHRLRGDRRRKKRLKQLDLLTNRAMLRGPSLWFRFMTRSLGHHTAKLIVEYNAYAIPLARLEATDDRTLAEYGSWLSRKLGRSKSDLSLPAAILRRLERLPDAKQETVSVQSFLQAEGFEGNDFTARHFLCRDPELDEDIRRRYGESLLELLRRDRRANFRRIFRTWPVHRWPKRQRTWNPYDFYQRHCSGGRILLLPLKLTWWGMRLLGWSLGQIRRMIREVLSPTMQQSAQEDVSDPFAVAQRKIYRMKAPLYVESARLRAEFDPEYLGVSLPGVPGPNRLSLLAPYEEDLQHMDAEPVLFEEFRTLATQRRQQIHQGSVETLFRGRLRGS